MRHRRLHAVVVRIIDADHYTRDLIDLHAGDDDKVFEVSYTRKK